MIKTRLSVAILAATFALTGCIGDDEQEQAVTESYVGFDPVVASADNANLPAAQQRGPVIPFPFDALFAGAKTPTLNIPNSVIDPNPLVTQANLQDGFSTTASWFIDIFGMVNLDTVAANKDNPLSNNLMIINKSTGQPLMYGTDFAVQSSTVKDDSGVPISAQRTRLLIEPLKPLIPNTTYVVLLKKGVKTMNGGMVQPSFMFNYLNSDTKIQDVKDSYFNRFNPTEIGTLEALRDLVRNKIVNTLKTIPVLGVTDSNVLLAYSVTTQSTTKTLDKVVAQSVAGDIAAFPTGKTVQDLIPELPANADVYVGTLKVPYYMETQADATADNKTPILNTFWKADQSQQADSEAIFLGVKGACAAYIANPSVSTTTCFPMPVKKHDQPIPMLITVPKTPKPPQGWPVVIFQHGITGNRTNMLPIAPAFAQAGYVTVAIDLPLHGILPTDATSGLRITNVSERTFDADFANNDNPKDTKPDGKVDASGSYFINLSSPLTSRDNVRQGAADILVLAKSLVNLDLDHDGQGDVDASKIRFTGISLGAIVGTVALGADKNKVIGAASLSVGSGGIAKMLDASYAYGPRIVAGLVNDAKPEKTVFEGTDKYEGFMRFAQTLTDAGDPINFAIDAKNNHPILFTEVLGDFVVPNKAVKTTELPAEEQSFYDKVGATGYLSGTEALVRIMDLDQSMSALDISAITATQKISPTGLGVLVKFKQGQSKHASLIDPRHPKDEDTTDAIVATETEKVPYLAVTQEMQRQTVNFIVSNGVCLPIGQNCAF
jgi:pimeloyl-ACP methyl ester carboxylesterase